jgi:adenosylhomocysteinase
MPAPKPVELCRLPRRDLKLADWGPQGNRHPPRPRCPVSWRSARNSLRSKPLNGARITGSLHMTIQTAVLIETLQALGAEVRWASCNIFSTQDHAAAAIAAAARRSSPTRARSLDEYWDYTHRIFEWPARRQASPNMILDDGGDATLLLHLGARARRTSCISKPTSEEETSLFKLDQGEARQGPDVVLDARGASARRDRRDDDGREAPLPDGEGGDAQSSRPINVNDSGHKEQVRQPLPAAASRSVDGHQARDRRDGGGQGRGRRGYGDVGKGSAQASARALGASLGHRSSTRICALQAAMEGYRVVTMDYACDEGDIFVTATGNYHVITHDHMKRMKDQAIVSQHRPLRQRDRRSRSLKPVRWRTVKPQGGPRRLPGRQAHHPAGRGPPGEPGLRHGPPVLCHELVVRQPDDRADRDVHASRALPIGVYVLPKHLDEKVARLQLKKLNAMLTELRDDQAKYIGVDKTGPYKPEHYRY